MDLKNLADLVGIIGTVVSSIGIIAGGLWAYISFIRNREGHPRIEFDVALDKICKVGGHYVVEASCNVNNKGFVRQKIKSLRMTIRFLEDGDSLKKGNEELANQTVFPHSAGKFELITEEMEWSFIEGGTSQRYSQIVHVSTEASLILVWAKIIPMKHQEEWYTAQRLYPLQSKLKEQIQLPHNQGIKVDEMTKVLSE